MTTDPTNTNSKDVTNEDGAVWVNWTDLEARLPLDDLPRFHRDFLAKVDPSEAWDEVFLRRIQGKVQASLKRLERQGLAKQQGGDLYVVKDLIPDDVLHDLGAL